MPKIATPVKISVISNQLSLLSPNNSIDKTKTNRIIKMRKRNILSSLFNNSPTLVKADPHQTQRGNSQNFERFKTRQSIETPRKYD